MSVRQVLSWGAAAALAFSLLILAGTDTASAGTFTPELKLTLKNTTPETPGDFTVDFGIRNVKDLNFGGVVSFIPGDFGIVRGDKLPIGEPVGKLDAAATLGLINSPCNQQLAVHFDMLNSSLDKSSTVSFKDLEAEAGDTSAEGFGTKDFAEDKDGNGLLDSVDHWPEYIDRVTGPVQPFRRSAGVATVAGIPVLLQFLVYDVGTKFDLPGEDLEKLLPNDPALGFPTIVLLQDIGDPEIVPEPGPITDFCSPLASQNVAYGTSYDADADGTSNEDDKCPYEAHPVMGTHDADFDFLDSQCDPDDAENTGKNEDQDGDGTDNFADNCALVANEDQADQDKDFIGDACDKNPSEPDGLVDLSMLPQAGDYKFTVFTVAQRDADNDGIQNSMDTCPYVANAGDSTQISSGDADQDGMDAACDPNDDPTKQGTSSDVDSDGYLNRQDNCPLVINGEESEDQPTGNQNDEDFDQIGDVCDNAPDAPDGELINKTLTGEIKIGAGGAGGPPTNCPNCFVSGSNPFESPTDEGKKVDSGDESDGGSDTGLIIAIVAGAAAAVVIIGGGTALLLRRRR